MKRHQFSLLSLLLAMAILAALLSGYRTGFQSGYSAGGAKLRNETPVTVVYPVQDLLTAVPHAAAGSADYSALIELITATVAPRSWQQQGGPGTCSPFESAASLVVIQPPEVQEEVSELLRQVRANQQSPRR